MTQPARGQATFQPYSCRVGRFKTAMCCSATQYSLFIYHCDIFSPADHARLAQLATLHLSQTQLKRPTRPAASLNRCRPTSRSRQLLPHPYTQLRCTALPYGGHCCLTLAQTPRLQRPTRLTVSSNSFRFFNLQQQNITPAYKHTSSSAHTIP
jgi:hypothetical protein